MDGISAGLDDHQRSAALALVALHQANVADLLLAELRAGDAPGMVAHVAALPDGYAQASLIGNDPGQLRWQVDAVPSAAAVELLRPLLAHLGEVPGATSATWWTNHRTATDQAATLGMTPGRALLRMTVPLPLDERPATDDGDGTPITIRSFQIGVDEPAWLAVNNAAFGWHPEQGGWTLDQLQRRFAEPWFQPEGFLVAEEHHEPGQPPTMIGFCWTKIHHLADGPHGEIYVIGVDPAAHGRGLGRRLTVAGFEWLADRGIRHGMLYVDADNHPAVSLYERLGMVVEETMRSFILDMTETTSPLPRWTTTDLFDSVGGEAFAAAAAAAGEDAEQLTVLFDAHGIGSTDTRRASPADGDSADTVIDAYNDVAARLRTLEAVATAAVSANSMDAAGQAALSELAPISARLQPLLARLSSWVAALGPAALAEHSRAAAEHLGAFDKLAERADHQMVQSSEELYAQLSVTGARAWNRLHSDLTSQLTGTLRRPDGSTDDLPISALRGLASHPDPQIRRAAYDAELDAWPTIAVASAAALNAIKGESITVNRRRGWGDPVDASLFANSVSRATFDAMQRAIDALLGDLHGWLVDKATLHGHHHGLPWWDLVAPLPDSATTLSWQQGIDAVHMAFSEFSPGLAALLERALAERWVDAGPRSGKVGGAFCMHLAGDRSLILLNWGNSAESAQTTAHEFGHAYHNVQLAARRPLQRMLPMALAETASTFCETLMVESALAGNDAAGHLATLDVSLAKTVQLLVDIRSRFLFESRLFDRRRRSNVSVADLNRMMLDAQGEAYADGLDQSTAHPWMWIVKGHYYSASFYNWPYSFGLLFGIGLYAAYRRDPDRFRATYDEALSLVGMEPAARLAERFGLRIDADEFWQDSVEVIRRRIGRYRELSTR